MTVEHVEVLVEERSTEAALQLILPKILREMSFAIYPYQCKDELLARLPQRLRGYVEWLPENWRIVVMVDRDDDDCNALKATLERMAADAGILTRSSAGGQNYAVLNRLAIEELEAWYFGDWEAVRAAYPGVPESVPRKASYRSPDAIAGGTWEAFERIMQRSGYFTSGLRKIEAARSFGAHMAPERNSSSSFQVLRQALLEMI
jgi:hypothetical protein